MTKINDEVLVESNGNVQVEGDFDWSPLPAGPWISDEYCGHDNDDSTSIDDEDDSQAVGETLEEENANKGLEDDELEKGELQHDEFIGVVRMTSSEPMAVEDESSQKTRIHMGGTQGPEDCSTEEIPRNGEDQSSPNINGQREGIPFVFNGESTKDGDIIEVPKETNIGSKFDLVKA